MTQNLRFYSIAIFSIFIGSQITEGCLLVPYWKTLPAFKFYEYYNEFGSRIGSFYTLLTIIAALIPVATTIYCWYKKATALKFSIIATFFCILFVASFYVYFKSTNQDFYNSIYNETQLNRELNIWQYWHWLRVFFEIMSLFFLIVTFNTLPNKK